LANGITPASVQKRVMLAIETEPEVDEEGNALLAAEEEQPYYTKEELERELTALRKAMKAAATALEFERAAALRDRIVKLEAKRG